MSISVNFKKLGAALFLPAAFLAVFLGAAAAAVPVSSITLRQEVFQVGAGVDLGEHAVVLPGAAPQQIVWELGQSPRFPAVPASNRTLVDGVLTATSEGWVQLRATIAGGAAGGGDFVRLFDVRFSSAIINVSHDFGILFEGVPASGNIIFTITGEVPTEPVAQGQPPWQFALSIYPSDFFVVGLPAGLAAGPAVRVADAEGVSTVVTVPVSGVPSAAGTWPVSVPSSIHERNIRMSNLSVAAQLLPMFSAIVVETSPALSQDAFTFDLNPDGPLHRDVMLAVDLRGRTLTGVRFGFHPLEQNADFFRFGNGVLLSQTFLSRMLVGTWDVTFMVSGGAADPVARVTVVDTRIIQQLPPVLPPTHPGDFPQAPLTPQHPDETFIRLSGGGFVDIMRLDFAGGRARVAPALVYGEATVTARAAIFEEMARRLPGERIEVSTPLSRLFVPTDLLNILTGARAAIARSGLGAHQIDVRISIADRTGDEGLLAAFERAYPGGLILGPLSELRVELVDSATGAVFFAAREFERPVETVHAVLQPGAHLRPAGVFFHQQGAEFAPFRVFSPGEVSVVSRFAGVHGVMQNGAHFTDIPPDHWAFEQAWTAAYSGLLTGGGELSWRSEITRGEFAQLLAFALQLPRHGAASSGFADVPAGHPMHDGVSRLNAAGLLWLWQDSLFHPDAALTREEMAAIVAGAVVTGVPVREPITRPLNVTFSDFRQFSTRLIGAVQGAVDYELMFGYGDGLFRPHSPATRAYAAEVAVNTARLLGLLD